MVADDVLVKKEQLEVDDLYSASPRGAYADRGGWNRKAVAALLPAVPLSALIALLPALASLAPLNRFVSAAAAAALYLVPARRVRGAPRAAAA